MTELDLLKDLHIDAERQGPGSTAETLRALELTGLPGNRPLNIADIGCGTGGQTMTLARNVEGQITAVDLFPDFLEVVKSRAKELGLESKICTLEKSMDELDFHNEQFDLIWSKGAIYHMGFEAGVEDWKRYLKPGGYLAVSEITWLTASRPKEIEEYWNEECPEIDTASNKIRVLEENGFSPTGYFTLSEESWDTNYYRPLEERFGSFLEKHNGSDVAQSIVEEHKKEIDMYRKYKDYYSYGFFIARRL